MLEISLIFADNLYSDYYLIGLEGFMNALKKTIVLCVVFFLGFSFAAFGKITYKECQCTRLNLLQSSQSAEVIRCKALFIKKYIEVSNECIGEKLVVGNSLGIVGKSTFEHDKFFGCLFQHQQHGKVIRND